jgi:ABC-type bacteriocin/lantibiotic exporter with double-glycine peptidase domain
MPEKPIEQMSVVGKLLALLPWRQRVRTCLLLLLTLTTAAVETMGIASIAPFLAVLATPEMAEKNEFLSRISAILHLENRHQFLVVLGLLSFSGLVAGSLCRALNNWGQIRFSRSIEYSLACRLMTDYLRRPFAFFLGRNNADLTKMVLTEVSQVVSGFLSPIIGIVSSTITMTLLLGLLCAVNAKLALGTAAVIAGLYSGIFLSLRRWLTRLGQRRFKANQQRFEAASEVFGGIKEIKLLGSEHVYLKRFSGAFSRVARAQANASLAGALPLYALELIAFGGGLLIALYFLQSSEDLARALPLIALYILCARRILPAIQGIFKNVTMLRYSQPAVNKLLQDFERSESSGTAIARGAERLRFEDAVVLKDVSFAYPNARKAAIANINLEIPKGARVGFVGITGSGKTTTVDVILGLLSPNKGALLVDGTRIGPDNVRSWQANLGYVPQHIYLADDSVAANIALGVPHKEMDQEAVEKAAHIANIHDFVANEMAQGYMTMVGERGIRLSGGQRQRIGVARALYRDPHVLLFDEATSALDNRTEKAVMQRLQSLGRDRTMIFIAHRLSTVRDCDVIYLFAGGKIEACGTYDELTETSAEFQSLAVPGS